MPVGGISTIFEFFLTETHSLPSYQIPDQSAFMTLHIASEAASVAKELLVYLVTFIHLTLSFDGWSSKGRDKIYTVHITTSFPRKSYLVGGLILTDSSTNAKTVFDRLKDVSPL